MLKIRQYDCRHGFRMIGHERFNVPGTQRTDSDATHQILHQQAGIDLDNSIRADGSGLSRHDLISPPP
ncbi:MAG: hypothetical protein GPOALKHO_001468 [Sodalis sp.]|nr:MAG: hypothetical protein GPOALKHO_001468 [Sodalis sp.]